MIEKFRQAAPVPNDGDIERQSKILLERFNTGYEYGARPDGTIIEDPGKAGYANRNGCSERTLSQVHAFGQLAKLATEMFPRDTLPVSSITAPNARRLLVVNPATQTQSVLFYATVDLNGSRPNNSTRSFLVHPVEGTQGDSFYSLASDRSLQFRTVIPGIQKTDDMSGVLGREEELPTHVASKALAESSLDTRKPIIGELFEFLRKPEVKGPQDKFFAVNPEDFRTEEELYAAVGYGLQSTQIGYPLVVVTMTEKEFNRVGKSLYERKDFHRKPDNTRFIVWTPN